MASDHRRLMLVAPGVAAGGIADGRGIAAALVGSGLTAWKGNAGQGADAHIGKGSSRAIQISRRSVKLRPADSATWQHSGLPLLPIACGQREHR